MAEYKRALGFVRLPAFVFNIAQCHRQLGEHREALFFYKLFLSEAPNAPNRAEVEGFVRTMTRKLEDAARSASEVGRLSIVTHPPGARILLNRMDGPAQGQSPVILEKVPTGEHLLVLKLPGHRDVTQKVEVKTGRLTLVELELTPLPVPRPLEPEPRRPARTPATRLEPEPRRPAKTPATRLEPEPRRPARTPATRLEPEPRRPRQVNSNASSFLPRKTQPPSMPLPAAQPFYRRWWFWTGAAITLGALGTSAYTGSLALARSKRWNDPQASLTDPDGFRRNTQILAGVTDTLWVTAAVVGVVTLVRSIHTGMGRREHPRATLAPHCTTQGCGLVLLGKY